jgi:hypothetical protein
MESMPTEYNIRPISIDFIPKLDKWVSNNQKSKYNESETPSSIFSFNFIPDYDKAQQIDFADSSFIIVPGIEADTAKQRTLTYSYCVVDVKNISNGDAFYYLKIIPEDVNVDFSSFDGIVSTFDVYNNRLRTYKFVDGNITSILSPSNKSTLESRVVCKDISFYFSFLSVISENVLSPGRSLNSLKIDYGFNMDAILADGWYGDPSSNWNEWYRIIGAQNVTSTSTTSIPLVICEPEGTNGEYQPPRFIRIIDLVNRGGGGGGGTPIYNNGSRTYELMSGEQKLARYDFLEAHYDELTPAERSLILVNNCIFDNLSKKHFNPLAIRQMISSALINQTEQELFLRIYEFIPYQQIRLLSDKFCNNNWPCTVASLFNTRQDFENVIINFETDHNANATDDGDILDYLNSGTPGELAFVPSCFKMSNGTQISVIFGDGANNKVEKSLIFMVYDALNILSQTESIESIFISTTTNGGHHHDSNHYKKRAVDISRMNDKKMLLMNAQELLVVEKLQNIFEQRSGVRENFGPFLKKKLNKDYVVKEHKDHIHISINANKNEPRLIETIKCN